MAAAAAKAVGVPPGFKFMPSDDELVRFYLLPYLRWQPLPVAGIILEDDPTKTPPWNLLERNGRGRDDHAYFFSPAAGQGRQARSVDGGGTWVTQKREGTEKVILDDGETVEWQKVRLSFHCGEGRSGSTGWVMHEYAVVKPADLGAPYRISHIAFTGYGRGRKRVHDGYFSEDNCKTTAICYPPHSGQERFLPAQSGQEHQESDPDQTMQLLPEQSGQEFEDDSLIRGRSSCFLVMTEAEQQQADDMAMKRASYLCSACKEKDAA